MPQTQLGEFAFSGEVGEVLDRVRGGPEMLWFLHERQRVFISHAPRDDAEVETAPFVKTLTGSGTTQRLNVRQVVDRILDDDERR